MKMPRKPPEHGEIWAGLSSPGRIQEILRQVSGPSVGQKYPHWDKLIRYRPPGDLSHEEWWLGLKLHRQGLPKTVELCDKLSQPFGYLLPDPVPERLYHLDRGAGGAIEMSDQITNPDTRNRYYIRSLVEEAITSSQLEGAATTRRVAREMIRSGRKPQDRSEQMILNNFVTMKRIGRLKDQPLTEDLVFELHRLITADTLDNPEAAGRFRKPDEPVVVDDSYGQVFHDPPDAGELPHRMKAMCRFANGQTPKGFLHPALRSIILHFWLAYDHPFVDGNGRTARALFYWSMLHQGFWLFEFISISQIIHQGPAKYCRAFLHTETDDNDLTYFIIYHLDVIQRAVDELHDYVARKTLQTQALERRLKGMTGLNHRQRALISHALHHPLHQYTIESHRTSHDVVYQTARTDLQDLRDRGLMNAAKVGKTWHFTPVEDLESRLAERY